MIAEFVGAALLVLLGDGVVASVALMGKRADWIVITTGWGLAVMLGVFVSGRLSGGHLNPAVTLGLASGGYFSWSRVGPYCLAQLAGGFAGAVLVYADYRYAFADFELKHAITRGALDAAGKLAGPDAGGAGVFATFPAYPSVFGNLLSEFIGTFLLLFGVRALTDKANLAPDERLQPVLIGLLVWAIGLSLGGLTGYAINPARDLGPRLAACVLGWGSSVFVSHGYYFWIPIVAPIAGGVVGTLLYDVLIGGALKRVASSS